MPAIETILLYLAALLLVSILASKISGRLGVPALLFFLAVGMLAGSEGPGGIYYDDPWTAQLLGVLALAFILFAGGLDTDIEDIRPVWWQGLVLATLGVLLTALIVGAAATWIVGFSLQEGVLLGAIVSSTDAAAVFAVLRSKGVGLKGSLKPLLELESGSNDPMAVFLTLGMINLITVPTMTVIDLVPMFLRQMGLGLALGYVIGRGFPAVLNRLRLEYDGLYSVTTIGIVLLTYGVTAAVGGNGFLAVYVAGVIGGNSAFIHRRSLKQFHDGLAWLMQILMFLTLGLLVFPSELPPIALNALAIAVLLILVARPLSVYLVLAGAGLNWREKAFVSWVGLRGAAPIVLATFPLLAGLPASSTIFNLVFFIVLTSTLVQGTSLPFVARLLGVDAPPSSRPAYPLEAVPVEGATNELVELQIPPDASCAGQRIVDLDLPETFLFVLISRHGEFVIPRGSSVLQGGDTVLALADRESLDAVRARLEKRSSAAGRGKRSAGMPTKD